MAGSPEPWFVSARWRRLAYAGLPAGLLAALALIHYPLHVTEPCVVRPLDRSRVRTEIDGLIHQTLVVEGERVKKGQAIARLDDLEIRHEVRAAEAGVARLTARLAELRHGSRREEIQHAEAEVAQRVQEVRFARDRYERQKRLFEQNVDSAQKRDDAHRDLLVKEEALKQARARRTLTRLGPRAEARAMAEADLARAQADLDYYKERREHLTIRSPVAGRVLTPRFHERVGEKVQAGALIAEIGDPDTMRAEIFVPERFVDVVKRGQPVVLKVHAFPLRAFTGQVSFIAPAVTTREGRRVLRVESTLDNKGGLLHAEMTGYAEIDTGDRSLIELGLRRVVRWIRVRFLI